jgi:hypothetical protein
MPAAAMVEAVRLAARSEGLLLDPVCGAELILAALKERQLLGGRQKVLNGWMQSSTTDDPSLDGHQKT